MMIFIILAMVTSIGLIATSVVLTMTQRYPSPLEQISYLSTKIIELEETARIWESMGLHDEAVNAIKEAERINVLLWNILNEGSVYQIS